MLGSGRSNVFVGNFVAPEKSAPVRHVRSESEEVFTSMIVDLIISDWILRKRGGSDLPPTETESYGYAQRIDMALMAGYARIYPADLICSSSGTSRM